MRDWRQPGSAGGSSRGGAQGWDQGWDDDGGDWEAQPRGRRRRDPGYDEVDLERALVPQNQGGLAPIPPQGGALAAPGFGAMDDEERALGIRRPVYIPATGDKPKVRPRSWRVLSGVLSVLLMCVASCAAAGLLGHTFVQGIFPTPIKVLQTPVAVDYSSVPATPIATVGPAGHYIFGVYTEAKQADGTYAATSHFIIGANVFVVVPVRGLPKGQHHVVSIRILDQGVDMGIQNIKGSNSDVDVTENTTVTFTIPNFPNAGVGVAKIYWDLPAGASGSDPNDPHLAASITFGVYQPTPTPIATSKTKTTTTTTPSTTKTPGK